MQLVVSWSAADPDAPAGDPYWANVVLLAHGDGGTGSTTFTDSSSYAHTMTPKNGATQDAIYKKFGVSSIQVSTGRPGYTYLTVPAAGSEFSFGAGVDFTIEMWLRPFSTDVADFSFILGKDNNSVQRGWNFYINKTNGNLIFFINPTSGAGTALTASGNFPGTYSGQWVHVAATRSGGDLRLFVNGQVVASASGVGYAVNNPSGPLVIGGLWNGSAVATALKFLGHLDDVRITNGVARYTSAFTVPAEAFPDS